jgi:hypothetical protein
VHDRDEIGDRYRPRSDQRRSQVGREGADPAGTRRVGGDDRRPHALPRRPCSRRGAERLHPLRHLQSAAHQRRFPDSLAGGGAQPLEYPLQALPHAVAPSRDSPETASGGLVQESEHGDADHTVAEPEAAQISGRSSRRFGRRVLRSDGHMTDNGGCRCGPEAGPDRARPGSSARRRPSSGGRTVA